MLSNSVRINNRPHTQ